MDLTNLLETIIKKAKEEANLDWTYDYHFSHIKSSNQDIFQFQILQKGIIQPKAIGMTFIENFELFAKQEGRRLIHIYLDRRIKPSIDITPILIKEDDQKGTETEI